MVQVDGSLERVYCPACGLRVDAPGAVNDILVNLRLRYVKEEGRNVILRQLRKSGMGRVPLRQVGKEFSDSRWPFILVVVDEA